MFNLDKFISDSVTFRPSSMFVPDIKANAETLTREIKGKKVCVIGGAGSIGSSFIKAVLRYEPISVVVVDLNENGLAELVRDVRSTQGLYVPDEFRCYTLNFADPIFERIFREERGFDIVANFSAHKHVRSEKDRYSVQALIENNDIKAKKLMDLLKVYPPKHFFCVSTDKAANPVNIMGASKRIMEDLVMAYNKYFKVTTARFANVAFSNGSLPDGWIHRFQKKQCANDAEAVAYAANMGYESEIYPVVYFGSDTTGEKAYEEFYVPGEKIDMQRFQALGVVEQTTRHEMAEVNGFFDKLEGIFAKEDFTKAQVVDAIKEFIPNFEHEEKGKNLDQKM